MRFEAFCVSISDKANSKNLVDYDHSFRSVDFVAILPRFFLALEQWFLLPETWFLMNLY